MKEKLLADLDVYKKSLTEKNAYLQQLKQAFAKTEVEINMLSGAVQACEKLLDDGKNDPRKTNG